MAQIFLPHFIIIGAMKSGTTTLYRYLDEHPGIDMSRDKETDFFVAEKGWKRGLAWYSNQFSGDSPLRGEASPNYTKARDFPGVPGRMADTCPDVRLIYILRDPVVRAESQFRHSVLIGDLPPTLEEFPDSHEYAHILDGSLYARQLDAYLEHFDRKAILVLDFKDLVAAPQALMDRVHSHIGAPARIVGAMRFTNDSAMLSRVPAPILRFAQSPTGRIIGGLVSRGMRDRIRGVLLRGKARQSPPFPEELRARLRADLAEDTARLREMTGQAFADWSV
ncbi:Sulfotransferase domain-containing protein [Jannaschia faecimaris]|uniref:Sulfotransferase domain-containing protein n=1 Tax=Jannaschia faecimaris TaxID=1244108 RepID=A0A1H3UGF7_9RHOB|nr:sulfotransferase [Jannaschia faecimaris]SDZ61474.1 Sulfotransferase domain-containing protein [Jannaschia faecimaris]